MLRELIAENGLPLVFLNVLLESLGLPVPAMPTLLLTGVITSLVGRHESVWSMRLSLFNVVLVATSSALVGDLLWYWMGRRYGSRVLGFLCSLSISRDSCVNKSGELFAKFGVRVLVVTKFIPGLSTLAVPVAGAIGVSLSSFLFYDAVGAALWATVGVALGSLFADTIEPILSVIDWLGFGTATIALITLIIYVGIRWRHRATLHRRLRMPRVDAVQLVAMLAQEPPPLVIDARRRLRRQIDPVRIPGAIVVDHDVSVAQLDGLDRSRKFVVYCDCPNEVSAALVAEQMKTEGYSHVFPLAGGLEAWRAAGFALEPLVLDEVTREAVNKIHPRSAS
ncbi:VTT domain-containing protein [Paraburkholderia sp. Cpub6]|uniref:VTT domain-containing protein n=1 Tax=Paraburkholderia sp. Cpub6 TaxID=2723094 RepID=UPI001612C58E|nr:VTT domain-containing protein [Paraburkholderia sp. Cpub6]MBB5460117.1 membrane protein DedA with SNARE-associated domain/rhodanese-related sulfurtransferase [Paraburkholderia sp. Cpub6]